MRSGEILTKLVLEAFVSCCSAAPRIAASSKSQYSFLNRALGFRDGRKKS